MDDRINSRMKHRPRGSAPGSAFSAEAGTFGSPLRFITSGSSMMTYRSQRHGFKGLSEYIEPPRPDHRPVHDAAREARLQAIARENEACADCRERCNGPNCPLDREARR